MTTTKSISSDIYALTEAIGTLENAIERSPPNLPDRFLFASGLCNAMVERYIRAGKVQDLEDAIKIIEPAVASAQEQITPSEYVHMGVYLMVWACTSQACTSWASI